MAALTSLFALITFMICAAYIEPFTNRRNKNTTSVHRQDGNDCATVERQNVAAHLLINIASTMVLGMSNTYQQLASALTIDDVRSALEKKGDARFGTNSPFSINNRKKGKLSSWLAWLLLIATSLPVHFLANSLYGLSTEIRPPHNVRYNATDIVYGNSSLDYRTTSTPDDLSCWTAFRAGVYLFPQDVEEFKHTKYGSPYTYRSDSLGSYDSIRVDVARNCTQYQNQTSDLAIPSSERRSDDSSSGYYYAIGECRNSYNVSCIFEDGRPPPCRLNARLQAAIILAGCLSIKAIYMIIVNIRARHRQKSYILTYGDAIMASVLEPALQVHGECLVNTEEGHRYLTTHTCHKHCRDSEPSPTGDDIGHCQTCKKHNSHNKAADLPHPAIAIKFKKSLLACLGGTATTQFITLLFSSMAFLGGTITLALFMISTAVGFQQSCANPRPGMDLPCGTMGARQYTESMYGAWGGYGGNAAMAALDLDSLASEQISFWIANGAQLLLSMLYLLLIYNFTLISMEREWGKYELKRKKLRCTLVRGQGFTQSYLLQLPKRVLLPSMGLMTLMHWLLAQSISTEEMTWVDPVAQSEHSQYIVGGPPLPSQAFPIFEGPYRQLTGADRLRSLPDLPSYHRHGRNDHHLLVGLCTSTLRPPYRV